MKRHRLWMGLLVVFLFLLTGCDPKYPPGNISVKQIQWLHVGETIEIKIDYPYAGGSMVFGWKNQKIEVVKNPDIIAIQNLKITAVETGTATIKVSATTELSDYSYEKGEVDKVYSVLVKIIVK
jgi:hypothetical protein